MAGPYRWLVVIMMVCAVTHLCFADEQLTNLNGEQDDDLLTISHGGGRSGGKAPTKMAHWMDEPSSPAPLESTEAEFDHPLINGAKNPKAPIQCDKYRFSIPASCLSDKTVLSKASGSSVKGFKGTAIQITKGQSSDMSRGGPGNLMKLQTKTYTLRVACAKNPCRGCRPLPRQIPFAGKMTLKTSTEVCCNCPECTQPKFQCKNQRGDKYCDQTAQKNICSTEQGIKECRKSCHRCPHNFPKCGGTCYTKETEKKKKFKQPIISKDSEEIKLNGKDLDLANEWQVCVAAALQEHATVEQRKGAAGNIGNMAGGGGYIGRGGGGGGSGELGESAGVGRRGSAGAPMMNPSFKMSANRAGNDEEVDLGESVGRRGSFSPVGSFSLTAGANRAGNDEEEEEL